jgi:hypothetical protein
VPRRRLRLRIRVYQQHGHVAHSRRRLGGGCVSASKSIPAVFFAHRVVPRVWPPVARFSPRLAPRALRTRAFPTPAAPKESAFATEITNTHLTFGYRARFAALLLTRPQASRTKNSRPRSRYGRAARTRRDAFAEASRSTRRRDLRARLQPDSTSAERCDWRDDASERFFIVREP